MKKTLIALMAMANVAFAYNASDITTMIQTGLEEQNYVAGDSFTITISGLSGGFSMTTGSDLKFGSQSNGGTQFINIANVGTSAYSWATATEYVTSGFDTTNPSATLTLTKEEAGNGYWISPALSKTAEGTLYINNGQTNNGVASITLAYKSGDDFTTVSLVREDGLPESIETFTTNVVITGWTFDASKLSVTGGTATQVLIPEPATATLSLLALAGLAARRRRK